MNRLPGWHTAGDPDAFLSSGDFVDLLETTPSPSTHLS